MMQKSTVVALAMALLVSYVYANAFDDYINAPDPTYNYKHVNTVRGVGVTTYNLFLTSQKWLTANDSDTPIWTHWVQVCVPDYIEPGADLATLYIDGGHTGNIDNPPKDPNVLVEGLALTSLSVSSTILAIPDEPIVFTNDPGHRRTEDAIIAYTWSHFINNTKQPNWLLRFPMTKAVVKAMDSIQDFVKTLKDVPAVNGFVVAGASKRGWTTWTTGAMDKRVKAIVPIVAPVGHLVQSVNVMWQAYGNWSFALDDYLAMNVMEYLNKPVFQEMMDLVAPMAYVDRMLYPKLMICSCGDEFFMPDAPTYMLPEFKGPMYLRMVPNAEHSLAGHQADVALTIQNFYWAVLKGIPLPQYTWTRDETTGAITLKTETTPHKVKMWHAHNYQARDFRLITCADPKDPKCINPIFWVETELHDQGNGTYVAHQPIPHNNGWVAYFIELQFQMSAVGHLDPMKVTTDVTIMPKQLPYPPCGANCGNDGDDVAPMKQLSVAEPLDE